MSFNGSGTYTLPAGNPTVINTTVDATVHNNTNSDIATALSNCVTRDGQSPPSANLPMNGHKLTGLSSGSGNGESIAYGQTGALLVSPVISSITNTGTLTLPTSTDTLVGRATTDTLTNKSLTSPTLTGTVTMTGASITGSPTAALGATTVTGSVSGGISSGTIPASFTGIGGSVGVYAYASGTVSGWYNTAASNSEGIGYNSSTHTTNVVANNAVIGSFSSTGLAVTGNVTSTTDSTFNGVKVGRGGGNIAGNTAVGLGAMTVIATGDRNTALGASAGYSITSGQYNLCVGYNSGVSTTTGSYNTYVGGAEAGVGAGVGHNNVSGVCNTYLGSGSGLSSTGGYNTLVGYRSGSAITTGQYNTIVGLYDGNNGGLDIRTLSNYTVISDGAGNIAISSAAGKSVALAGAVPNAGTGITFPATQNASSDANTLDDYEEGTWTPTQGAGLTVVGAFSSGGAYTKIGRLVTVTGYVSGATSVAVSSNGQLTANLPFTGSAASEEEIGNVCSNVMTQAGACLVYNATLLSSAVTAVTRIQFTITYRAI